MSDQLLPCPFCGSASDMRRWGATAYGVACRQPGCIVGMGDDFTSEAEAIAAWNRRASAPRQETVVEQLRLIRGVADAAKEGRDQRAIMAQTIVKLADAVLVAAPPPEER